MTGSLPLIDLPRKRVAFNPTASIIDEPEEKPWRNLTAELDLRRRSSIQQDFDVAAASVLGLDSPSKRGRPIAVVDKVARFQQRIKKTFLHAHLGATMRRPFHHRHPEGDQHQSAPTYSQKEKKSWRLHSPIQRKRKIDDGVRMLTPTAAAVLPVDDANGSQITSELLEIFDMLTIKTASPSKKPRLGSCIQN